MGKCHFKRFCDLALVLMVLSYRGYGSFYCKASSLWRFHKDFTSIPGILDISYIVSSPCIDINRSRML